MTADELNPLEPQGCAACDRGETYTEDRAYVHTGFGAYCRRRQIAKLTPADPEPTPRETLSVKTYVSEAPRGQYRCGNCGALGHNGRTCKEPKIILK